MIDVRLQRYLRIGCSKHVDLVGNTMSGRSGPCGPVYTMARFTPLSARKMPAKSPHIAPMRHGSPATAVQFDCADAQLSHQPPGPTARTRENCRSGLSSLICLDNVDCAGSVLWTSASKDPIPPKEARGRRQLPVVLHSRMLHSEQPDLPRRKE
jgi:hypothetical protein